MTILLEARVPFVYQHDYIIKKCSDEEAPDLLRNSMIIVLCQAGISIGITFQDCPPCNKTIGAQNSSDQVAALTSRSNVGILMVIGNKGRMATRSMAHSDLQRWLIEYNDFILFNTHKKRIRAVCNHIGKTTVSFHGAV